MSNLTDFSNHITQLKQKGQWRSLPQLQHQARWIIKDGHRMLNLSSNDYLGLANDLMLRQQFLQNFAENSPLASSSSRLLTGSFPIYNDLEQLIAKAFAREACLIFNSGYHANIGILPALANKKTLIVADKLVHASIIDGIRLSQCQFIRYRHNDYEHLAQILEKNHQTFERIIIVTESIFSMDGDVADLSRLVTFKRQFNNIMLYVDEAHAIGLYGNKGLGIAEQQHCIPEIDILVGTFGKALGSMGAYVVCDQILRDYLINTMRPLIFSTALPPFNVAWSYFLFEKLPHFSERRQHLAHISQQLRQCIEAKQNVMPSTSHIVPYILGDNQLTIKQAQHLQQLGYYCLPIRPPTVPQGTSRIRLSLTADITQEEISQFISCLEACQ